MGSVFKERKIILDEIIELTQNELKEFVDDLNIQLIFRKRLYNAIIKLQKEKNPQKFENENKIKNKNPLSQEKTSDNSSKIITKNEISSKIIHLSIKYKNAN